MASRLTEQIVSDAAGDRERVLQPGDFVLNRRLRTVKLTKQGMKHALRFLRKSRLTWRLCSAAVSILHRSHKGMRLHAMCHPTSPR